MEDKQIIELYWNRLETAIEETSRKYSRFCFYIANHILGNKEDSDECVNDTYLHIWNAIPPHRPISLKAFIGKITRNLALHKWENYNAKKRGEGAVPMVLEELHECVSGRNDTEDIVDQLVLTDALNVFLGDLNLQHRKLFMERYFYFSSIKEIASKYNMSESNVKMTLSRLRQKLKELLEKEGIIL